MAVDWIDAGIGIVGGGALGTFASYFIAPKAQRDQNKLARDMFEADQAKPLRERQIAVIEHTLEVLQGAHMTFVNRGLVEPEALISAAMDASVELVQCLGRIQTFVPDKFVAESVANTAKSLISWTLLLSDDLRDNDVRAEDFTAARDEYIKHAVTAQRRLGDKLASL